LATTPNTVTIQFNPSKFGKYKFQVQALGDNNILLGTATINLNVSSVASQTSTTTPIKATTTIATTTTKVLQNTLSNQKIVETKKIIQTINKNTPEKKIIIDESTNIATQIPKIDIPEIETHKSFWKKFLEYIYSFKN
jgi:hypothetical protein